MSDSSLAGTPSMLIWVVAEASLVSGPGDTVTRSPASAAETFSVGGTQLGAVGLWAAACADGSATSPTNAASTASEASPASRARTTEPTGGPGTSP